MATINYPTPEWIDRWIDSYMDKHPDEKISDFDALKAEAENAWWDNEIEHDRPTPFDLTPEQEKVSQKARQGARAVNAFGKEVKRVRKANPDKRFLIERLRDGLIDGTEDLKVTITNPERQLDFEFGGILYSVTLTAHRPPKK